MAKGQPKNPAGANKSTLKIGRSIIGEWIAIVNSGIAREMDPVALASQIRAELVTSGGTHGPLEVGVVVDPIFRENNAAGQKVKFMWVCVPAPEELTQNWLINSGYAELNTSGQLVPKDTKADELGGAVLFGCGR